MCVGGGRAVDHPGVVVVRWEVAAAVEVRGRGVVGWVLRAVVVVVVVCPGRGAVVVSGGVSPLIAVRVVVGGGRKGGRGQVVVPGGGELAGVGPELMGWGWVGGSLLLGGCVCV